MAKKPKSLYQSAVGATEIFHTFSEGKPDLIDLGIPAITRKIGGMFPGNLVGIAAGQNVGKSSVLLAMASQSKDRGGIIELEDGEDVWGARLLARYSDVPPTAIRIKEHQDGTPALTEADKDRLSAALGAMQQASNEGQGPWIDYRIGGSVDDVAEAVEALAETGCRWIALNYLQKPRGHNSDRRSEVGLTMNRFHKACADANVVPVLVSQIVRMKQGVEPFPGHMKESGDIENECRMIIMFWRDPANDLILRGKVAKSSFGGGGLRFAYRFTDAEYLVEVDPDDFPETDGDEPILGDEDF